MTLQFWFAGSTTLQPFNTTSPVSTPAPPPAGFSIDPLASAFSHSTVTFIPATFIFDVKGPPLERAFFFSPSLNFSHSNSFGAPSSLHELVLYFPPVFLTHPYQCNAADADAQAVAPTAHTASRLSMVNLILDI